MRKITIIIGQDGITLTGDTSEISSQLIGGGWTVRNDGHFKRTTMAEAKSIIRMFGEPSSVSEKIVRNVTIRADTRGNVVVEGNTSPIKDALKSAGGLWSPQSQSWSFQGDAQPLVAGLISDGSCDTEVIDLTWNTPQSPLLFRGSPFTAVAAHHDFNDSVPASPFSRRYSGELPSDMVAGAVTKDRSGKVVRASGIPVPGVTEASSVICSLCGGQGHTRTDCICPFCRYINLHNPMVCPSHTRGI